MNRTCIQCDSRLFGRSDQKFCSDACRNRFHNNQKREENASFRKVNSILRRNRMILFQLFKNNCRSVALEELIIRGFSSQFFTAFIETTEGNRKFICYDMCYTICKQKEPLVFIESLEME